MFRAPLSSIPKIALSTTRLRIIETDRDNITNDKVDLLSEHFASSSTSDRDVISLKLGFETGPKRPS